ncbi:MAG: hypothetical protein IJT95_00620, partial [Abditibacteriota bacterium]|nr:hypothetical protein [Abditibacteriota bacterium]
MQRLLIVCLLLLSALPALGDYRPSDLLVWDGWTVFDGLKAHLYYLQYRGPSSVSPKGAEDMLGHAVSGDLFNWTEMPGCLGPGEAGAPDDMQPWTGCTVVKDGRYYLFYTMRNAATEARQQKIGLAISRDGQHFEKYAHNPVIVPDGRWYIDDYSVCRSIDCRDLTIVEYKGGYVGYFVTRQKGSDPVSTNCIGCAESDDLIHWRQRPPVFVSSKYACTECPDVFEAGGKWFLTLAAANTYGSIVPFADDNVINGNVYAVADSPFGPFREPRNNVLLGAGGCFRTLMFKGDRYGIFCAGSASRPYLVRARGERLTLEYPARLRENRRQLPGGEEPRLLAAHPAWKFASGSWKKDRTAYRGRCDKGYQACDIFRVPSEEFSVSCRLEIKGAGGGIVIRPDPASDTSYGDTCVYIDKKKKTIRISSMADMARNTWNTRTLTDNGSLLV